MKSIKSSNLIMFLHKYNGKIIIFPENVENLYDLFELNIIPDVIDDEKIDMSSQKEIRNTLDSINQSLKIVKSKQVAKWSYGHYDLNYLLNNLDSDNYFDDYNYSCDDVYSAILAYFEDSLLDEKTSYKGEYIDTFYDLEEKNLLELDFNGDLLIADLRISELIDIFIANKCNMESIEKEIAIKKTVNNF
jgi:hypothetical protein